MKPTHREDAKAQFVRDVMPHFEYLRTNAYVMTGCRADAEDLVQETMLKAYVGLRTFEPGGNIRAWLHRIMSNVFVDNYRSAQRRPPTRLTGDVALMVTQSETAASRPEARSAETHALESLPGDVSNAVRSLPEDLKLTVFYAHVLEYRNVEIAAILGIPVGTVASRLHRARRRMRDLLQRRSFGCAPAGQSAGREIGQLS
ncbi:RNA polymerase sigma-70 factor, ECF subfamily [Mycolicibacterium rutilum]|uniref:RNA polymerase sigma factor n=1 Tax=Mycolicibacterium rutilum TaxID=370526 RepID=A0A1H6IU62_MYCRU|nr:RNA polymerase sigma factor [Mycolicibacterium rutilum]SEH50618.1 RNA polymerase sigma-70 factor, ECF subfamily [Mycolicibacterium rutilum]